MAVAVPPELLRPEGGAAALVVAADAADQLRLCLEDSAEWVVVLLKQIGSQEPAE